MISAIFWCLLLSISEANIVPHYYHDAVTMSRSQRTVQALGVFHVLTGPDHLSAIATLSANVGSFQAFILGVRWGIGHSTGLLLVGLIFIFLTLDSDAENVDVPDAVSTIFESLVGIFMLVLGAYGVRRAWDRRPKDYYGIIPDAAVSTAEYELGVELRVDNHHHNNNEQPAVPPDEERNYSTRLASNSSSDPAVLAANDSDSEAPSEDGASPSLCRRLAKRISTGTMAIVAGIIHGMAGPGGVLGVIPAVQLHNLKLASIYLSCFCLSSTLTMGIFATLYGTLSSRIGSEGTHRQFVIECLSSCLSILVGITWLILLSIGKLEDVFP